MQPQITPETKRKEKLKTLERDRDLKALKYYTLFSSPEGKEVLRELRAQFGQGELSDDNPNVTLKRAHQRDVHDFIMRLVRHGEYLKDAGQE